MYIYVYTTDQFARLCEIEEIHSPSITHQNIVTFIIRKFCARIPAKCISSRFSIFGSLYTCKSGRITRQCLQSYSKVQKLFNKCSTTVEPFTNKHLRNHNQSWSFMRIGNSSSWSPTRT